MLNTQSVLDSLALAYEPVWAPDRHLVAARLHLHPVTPTGVDAAHFMELLGEHWPEEAPTLILSIASPRLLLQTLAVDPVHNTCIEVPADLFARADTAARLSIAVRRGHRLVCRTALSGLHGPGLDSVDARPLVHLTTDDARRLLAAVPPGRTPPQLPPGLIVGGADNRTLLRHLLEEQSVHGVLGWPEDDVLASHRHHPISYDRDILHAVLQAIDDDDCSVERLERLVRQDAVLVYRLLLLVNSAAYGNRREIGSLRHALMMLGFRELGRWVTEQITEVEPDPDLHPVRLAMVMRARLAQHLLMTGSDDTLRAEVYATALMGELGRLLHQPLAMLLNKLPLPGRIFDALLRRDGPYFSLVDTARALGQPADIARLPLVCRVHDISLETANRSLLRMLATSHSHAGRRSERMT